MCGNMNISLKKCSKCKEEKPATAEHFYWRKDQDKFRDQCKDCFYHNRKDHKLINKKLWHIKNRDKELERNKQWYKDNKEKHLEYGKQAYKNNLAQKSRFRNVRQQIIIKEIKTDQDYIDIWLMFDTHYGSVDTDTEYLQEYIQWVDYPSRYKILGGDLCEYSLATGNIKFITSSDKVDLEQIHWLKDKLSHNSHKNLVFLAGNHERRYTKNNPLGREYDIFKTLCSEANVPYIHRQSTYLEISLNDINYLFLLLHGDGMSSYLPSTSLRQAKTAGLVLDGTDFIVVGHSHHNLKDMEDFSRIRVGNQIRTDYHTKFIKPGSFLVDPDYVRRDRNVPVGNVILRLFSQHKYSLSFRNLEDLKKYEAIANSGNNLS